MSSHEDGEESDGKISTMRDGGPIPGVPDQRIVAIVNSFVVHVTKLVNRVCALSEKKLMDADRGIRKLHIALAILEKKLANIDAPEEASAPSLVAERGGVDQSPGERDRADDVREAATTADEGDAVMENAAKARDHPLYQKYFKMLAVGVLEIAVKYKMETEGLDPAIIHDPNAILPLT